VNDAHPSGGDRARRAGVVAAMVALFVLALGVFVLPFAFPTPPPIVTRFQATALFSPDGDGRREQATISVRLNEPSAVTIDIQKDGETVRALASLAREPKGWVRAKWDGRDDAGRRVADGTYAIKLRTRAGRKQFNTSRAIVVDTVAPRLAAMSVDSATLAGPGPGECRVSIVARDAGSVVIEALRPGRSEPLRRLGPRPIRPETPLRWNWDGARAGGGQVPPGLYLIRTVLSDVARNRVVRERTCWVGGLVGEPVPARVAPRGRVGASLQRTDGARVSPSTVVTLALYRRTGVPGESLADPLGAQVGPGARGPVGRARVRVPAGLNPGALWLVARTDDGLGAALIGLTGRR
jgi:hypothetical protein